MSVGWENDISDFKKKCNLLNAITKIDIRFIDKNGHALFQLVDHLNPVTIQGLDKEFFTIMEQLKKNETTSYYYHVNSFNLEYIATGIWKGAKIHGFILIGPFVSNVPSIGFISSIITKNKIPISERKQLEAFYQSLSVMSRMDSNRIGELLVNVCAHSHIESQLITTDVVHSPINRDHLKIEIAENKNLIEARLQLEKDIMNAIAKGNTDEITRISNENNMNILSNFADRIPESPLRSIKNITLVMNTICRTAAERGGVPPIYIHHLSEKFAILIERAPNLNDLKKLGVVMINEYCTTVKKISTRHFSAIVKKAVDYIHLHLEDALTLNKIASKIHVNASHLSRKFKADTNMNIIDYINQKRVEEAKLYLQKGNVSITEIALMIGFNDLNYFSRVFKKSTSMSPSQYRKHSI
ncbi:helix-turn-helix domain-containing protein [Oceanobacillus longus]|uniref:Helix-turn-helix domain-containing protein n=1 Tax=Oceanobacillus longus TaxID=930120 RepID=A0ABV8H303_9BACI